jgi:methyl-accepting chemotaxis protein
MSVQSVAPGGAAVAGGHGRSRVWYVATGLGPLLVTPAVVFLIAGRSVTWTAVLVALVLSAFAAVVAWTFLLRRLASGAAAVDEQMLSREIGRMVDAIREIAKGDLNAQIGFDEAVLSSQQSVRETGTEGPGDLGSVFTDLTVAFDEMTEGLRSVIGLAADISRRVQDGSDALAEASDESNQASSDVAGAISSVADGAVSQAAIADRVATYVEDIGQTVASTAATVHEVLGVSQQAEGTAESGRTRLNEAVQAMERITSSFGDVAGTVLELGSRSEKVEEIVDLIRSIAEQTNLLALNAAIEAARAGDAGRGFAVVAAEVKSLAEESAQSTEQIADLVGSMRASVTDARRATDSGQAAVDDGARIIGDASGAFGDIVDAVSSMETKVNDLSTATTGIAGATESIGLAVKDLVVVAESNSAAAEEVAASSEELAASSTEIGHTAQDLATSSRELAAALRRFTFGDGSLDFAAAISAHRAWKARIRNYLRGREQLHPEDVAAHTDCELGLWLYGMGIKTYGDRAEMQSLERDHQSLHEQIHAVIAAKTAGDDAGADQAYNAVAELSTHVVADLTALQNGG